MLRPPGVNGGTPPEFPTATTWLALAYLIVFGSIVAYTAYMYLLRTVRPALATSYAYANPVVAVVLGVTIGGEILTGPALVALPLILLGVAIVALARTPGEQPFVRPLPRLSTFLLTDVAGSTRLWETDPELMHAAMARHDEIIRTSLEAHGGHIFSVAGDSVAAVFEDASAAAVAALQTQRSLGAEEWGSAEIRVRIGLNSGEARERDGRYYGPAVNRAARIAEAANGGQVVVSCCTHELLHSALPHEIELTDLGEHRLRDLREERVYQLSPTGFNVRFPPLRTLEPRAARPAVA